MALALAPRRSLYSVPAVLLLLAALDLSRVSVVPPADYTMARTPHGFDVAFHVPISAAYVQFGRYWETWFVPPDWQRFSVVITGTSGRKVRELLSAGQVISASCTKDIGSITVEGPPSFAMGSELGARFIVYRSQSTLRTYVGDLRKGC